MNLIYSGECFFKEKSDIKRIVSLLHLLQVDANTELEILEVQAGNSHPNLSPLAPTTSLHTTSKQRIKPTNRELQTASSTHVSISPSQNAGCLSLEMDEDVLSKSSESEKWGMSPGKVQPSTSITTLEKKMAPVHEKFQKKVKVTKNKTLKVLLPRQTSGNFVCNFCDKIYKYEKGLSRHIAEVHDIEDAPCKTFNCVHCNKEFRRKSILKRHQESNVCSENFAYSCSNCSKGFETSDKLKMHLLKNCPKKYRCGQCNSYFKFERSLLVHYDATHAHEL